MSGQIPPRPCPISIRGPSLALFQSWEGRHRCRKISGSDPKPSTSHNGRLVRLDDRLQALRPCFGRTEVGRGPVEIPHHRRHFARSGQEIGDAVGATVRCGVSSIQYVVEKVSRIKVAGLQTRVPELVAPGFRSRFSNVYGRNPEAREARNCWYRSVKCRLPDSARRAGVVNSRDDPQAIPRPALSDPCPNTACRPARRFPGRAGPAAPPTETPCRRSQGI